MHSLHVEGGMSFMVPLSILFVSIIVLIIIAIVRMRQGADTLRLLELMRQVGGVALAWGVLGTVVALFAAFGSLSQSTETLPTYVIMGGLRVALITALYGLVIFLVSLIAYMVLKFLARRSDA